MDPARSNSSDPSRRPRPRRPLCCDRPGHANSGWTMSGSPDRAVPTAARRCLPSLVWSDRGADRTPGTKKCENDRYDLRKIRRKRPESGLDTTLPTAQKCIRRTSRSTGATALRPIRVGRRSGGRLGRQTPGKPLTTTCSGEDCEQAVESIVVARITERQCRFATIRTIPRRRSASSHSHLIGNQTFALNANGRGRSTPAARRMICESRMPSPSNTRFRRVGATPA